MSQGPPSNGVSASILVSTLLLISVAPPARGGEQALRAEVEELKRRVVELEARLGERSGPAGIGPADSTPLTLRQPLMHAELYGFLTSETVWESAGTDGDRFLNIVPFGGGEEQDDEFLLSANATRLGLSLRSAALQDRLGASARGVLEVDFDSPDGGPRIRHAYAELVHPRGHLLFGQTWVLVAQLNPDTINNDNLFNLGNAYERVPQIRVSKHFALGSGEFDVAAAALRFFRGFDQGPVSGIPLALQQPPGSRFEVRSSGSPLGQFRLAWRPRANEEAYAALSFGAGRVKLEDGAGRRETVPHLLGAAELVLPPWGPFTLSAEVFWGEAAAFNVGVGQTVAVNVKGRARAIESWGGFVQLAYRPSERLRCHLIYGLDNPENRASGLRVPISLNQTALANCFWRLLPPLELALEVQGVRSEWQPGRGFDAEDLRVTQAVYLNF